MVQLQAARLRLVGASGLLGAAGLLTVAASAQRWWSACGIRAFDDLACQRLQDHVYDFTLPVDPYPWAPTGAAAELHALALLCLAAAVLALPAVLAPRRPKIALNLAAAGVAAGIAFVAVATWLSGRAGEVVAVPGLGTAELLWIMGLPVLAGAAVALSGPAPTRVWAGRFGVAIAVVGSNPAFGALLFAPILLGYLSYDTTPWTEAVSGLFLIAAAVCLWPAARWGRVDREGSPDRTTSSSGVGLVRN